MQLDNKHIAFGQARQSRLKSRKESFARNSVERRCRGLCVCCCNTWQVVEGMDVIRAVAAVPTARAWNSMLEAQRQHPKL